MTTAPPRREAVGFHVPSPTSNKALGRILQQMTKDGEWERRSELLVAPYDALADENKTKLEQRPKSEQYLVEYLPTTPFVLDWRKLGHFDDKGGDVVRALGTERFSHARVQRPKSERLRQANQPEPPPVPFRSSRRKIKNNLSEKVPGRGTAAKSWSSAKAAALFFKHSHSKRAANNKKVDAAEEAERKQKSRKLKLLLHRPHTTVEDTLRERSTDAATARAAEVGMGGGREGEKTDMTSTAPSSKDGEGGRGASATGGNYGSLGIVDLVRARIDTARVVHHVKVNVMVAAVLARENKTSSFRRRRKPFARRVKLVMNAGTFIREVSLPAAGSRPASGRGERDEEVSLRAGEVEEGDGQSRRKNTIVIAHTPRRPGDI